MNQQDKDNQRAAFEAWARKNDYLIHRSPNDERRYERGFTQDVWEAWQAAIAHDRQQEEEPPTSPNDDIVCEHWVTASDVDGIVYDGPSFERGYLLGMDDDRQQREQEYPHEQMDAIGAARFKVVPCPKNVGLIFSTHAVRAGDGEQILWHGSKSSCEHVARRLTGAFFDGGWVLFGLLGFAGQKQRGEPVKLSPDTEQYADRISAIAKQDEISNDDKHRLLELALSVRMFGRRSSITESVSVSSDDAAVDAFAAAMKAKLAKKRADGRGGWQECSSEYLSNLLHEHVSKGDPVDVANLAMMLHQNGQRIEPVSVPSDDIEESLKQLEALMHRVSKAGIMVGYGADRAEAMLEYAEAMFMNTARALLANYGHVQKSGFRSKNMGANNGPAN